MAANSNKLEDQAATAALYATRNEKKDQAKAKYPLDEDNRLSSAGAATSLKYASPRDLPSYPITGLEHGEAGAGAAASLANANHKDFELWKPDASVPASKAAIQAKDYKSAPLWQPERSNTGSKAAYAAAEHGGHVNIWKPEATSAGNSAAGLAMRAKGLSPQAFGGVTGDDNRKALQAATGAMSSNRRRAGSSPNVAPASFPDSANSAANALKAATSVSKSSSRGRQTQSPGPSPVPIDAARIHNAAVTNLSREMYTSNPPVAPEVEEKNRQAGLRAAAVSMAKKMYDVQQHALDEAAKDSKADSHYAATSVHNRQPSVASTDDLQSAPRYVNLQEAAQKLAAERLAKLHDEHAAYRNYYGANTPVQKRLSIRGRTRRRASSDGNARDSDEERSRKIRNDMSLFKDELAQVDAKKRQTDREALMAAAQRNVKASMTGLDEKVFNQTGKASPAMMEEWENKAKARAQAESDTRMVNHGRVNIGGGKYLDQSEIDNIAAGRVQPTLDEITQKAEAQRARDEELRRQQEEREQMAAEKAADQKERDLKTKEAWRQYRDEEKAEAKTKKEEEKARKAETKRLRDEEKRKSKAKNVAEPNEEKPSTASEPLIVAPISSVEPISSDEERFERPQQRTTLVEEIKLQAEETKQASLLEERQKAEASVGSLGEEPTSTPAGSVDPSTITESAPSTAIPEPSEMNKSPNADSDITSPTKTQASSVTPEIAPKKPTESVHQRIALPAATTETIVTGPDPTSKPAKGEGKVSSWLKNKLRRSSKANKPETSPAEAAGRSFVGGASLTAPTTSTNKSSTDQGVETFAQEKAAAGKKPASSEATAPTSAALSAPVDTPAAAPMDSDDDDELYAASTRDKDKGKARSQSLSLVSSLSSDEGEHPRGRSQLRRETTTAESEENDEDDFEEARDTFETEKLAPPGAFRELRAADSPVRDSKFLEDL